MMGINPGLNPPVHLGQLERSLGFLLRIAQLRVFEKFFTRFGDKGMKPGEFSVLFVIHLNPSIRQGVLAETLRIKPAHMTKIIRRYERLKIVRREIPDDDRRSVLLTLTHEGDSFVKQRQPDFFGDTSYNAHNLSPDELEQFIYLLKKYSGIQP